MLSDAIKGVYASVFFRDSNAYMQATSNVIDQEKMTVILQQVVGTQYGDRFYPSISGVARSLTYYSIGDEKAEEGTVSLALGPVSYTHLLGNSSRMCFIIRWNYFSGFWDNRRNSRTCYFYFLKIGRCV